MTKALSNTTTNSFTLKGGLYTLTTLHLQSVDLTAIEAQLAATVQQAPKYFDHTPVVIDLQAIATVADPLDLSALATCLRAYKLVPIGLRGGNEQQRQAGFAANWALLPETQKHSEATPQTQPKAATTASQQNMSTTKLITQPVRSGQQIYAQGGDLIVLAPVSAGAEILADGHIHVYAPLRGRALAGVLGNTFARIFCQQLEAELISIAGHYKVSEQLKDQVSSWGKSTVISLTNEQLSIQTL